MCGKTPETAALQDLLVHYSLGISQYAHAAAQAGTWKGRKEACMQHRPNQRNLDSHNPIHLYIYPTPPLKTNPQKTGAPRDSVVDRFLLDALFSTLTNVNFDPDRFVGYLADAEVVKARAKAMYEKAAGPGQTPLTGPAEMDLARLQVGFGVVDVISGR